MKITLRRIFLSLVLIVLVFLAAVILFLRSPSASRILIAKTQDVLAKSFNTQLTFSDGRVDIFTGLHFKNLKILWKSGENKADIAIDEITARYEFSILSKSFDLKVLQIEHPAIVFSAISEKIPAEVAATSPADFTSLIKSMREFFENPPVRVKIENFSLHHLDLQFTKGNPVTELKAEAHNLDFNLSFASLKNQLAAKSEFTTGDDLTVMMIAKKNPAIADSPSGETSLKLKFVGKLDAGIHQDKGLWLYEIKPTQFLMDLKDIHVGQENSARVMHVKIPLLHSTSDFKLLAKTAELFALNRNSFDVVDL